jgi:hypothetical protein
VNEVKRLEERLKTADKIEYLYRLMILYLHGRNQAFILDHTKSSSFVSTAILDGLNMDQGVFCHKKFLGMEFGVG